MNNKISALFSTQLLRNTATIFLLMITLNLSAQSGNYTSSKVENSIIVDKSADQVWTLISKVENLSLLVPKVIKKVEANGNGVYTSWIIYLQNDLWIKEEMTYFNEEDMEFAYVMTKTPMPLSDYLAIQKVDKIDDYKSRVTFTTYFNANSQNRENLKVTFTNFQTTFLNNIKKHIK